GSARRCTPPRRRWRPSPWAGRKRKGSGPVRGQTPGKKTNREGSGPERGQTPFPTKRPASFDAGLFMCDRRAARSGRNLAQHLLADLAGGDLAQGGDAVLVLGFDLGRVALAQHARAV